jgi:hypothetical protein
MVGTSGMDCIAPILSIFFFKEPLPQNNRQHHSIRDTRGVDPDSFRGYRPRLPRTERQTMPEERRLPKSRAGCG